MSFRKETPPEVKWRERRRGVRMNSRVKINVEWEAKEEGVVQEVAVTRMVSPYGCLVVLKHDLPLDQKLRVTNLVNHQSTLASVVWKGHERAEGFELGIELVKPEMDFWGMEL